MEDYLLFGPVISLVFGMLIGSFINCLAWRLYKEETIFGRSYCPKCLGKIKWYDNIPVLSFLILKGKCRSCTQKISWQYPLVELITGLLFYGAFLFLGGNLIDLIRSFIIISILVLVFIFDFRWYLIPVSALLWSTPVIIILGALTYPLNIGYYIFALVITMAIATIFFGAQYLITRGKGIGEGDIWLGAFLGAAFFNLRELSVAVLSAYCIGALVGIILLISGNKKWGSKLPLGVFLSIGAIIGLFWGGQIASWYLSLFSL
jgi:Type II secretory pathway, prepilin signal peptidase PulO and related peptidases